MGLISVLLGRASSMTRRSPRTAAPRAGAGGVGAATTGGGVGKLFSRFGAGRRRRL